MTNPVTIEAPAGLPYVDIAREFDAPPAAVFEAHRDPALVAQWLGPNGYEMDVERWDFVSQGAYRYVHRDPKGDQYAFRGTFHTIQPDLLIQTFEFEGVPGVVSIDSMRIESLDGGSRTRLVGHSVFPSVEARDAMIESGMARGVTEGYERLVGLLASVAA